MKSQLLLLFAVLLLPTQADARRYSARRAPVARSVAPATPPKDGDVCFSPDENCDAKLIALVSTAERSVDVAIYDVTLDQLVHQLAILKAKGKAVRVVVDRRQSHEKNSLVGTLIRLGVPVKFGVQRGIMHDKFMIVDDRMLETGSFNYTNHASCCNHENQIYLANPATVRQYQAEFERLWESGEAVQ